MTGGLPPASGAASIRHGMSPAVARRKSKGDIAVVWLQEEIRNEEARRLAEEAGITFVEDLCIKKERQRLFPGK